VCARRIIGCSPLAPIAASASDPFERRDDLRNQQQRLLNGSTEGTLMYTGPKVPSCDSEVLSSERDTPLLKVRAASPVVGRSGTAQRLRLMIYIRLNSRKYFRIHSRDPEVRCTWAQPSPPHATAGAGRSTIYLRMNSRDCLKNVTAGIPIGSLCTWNVDCARRGLG